MRMVVGYIQCITPLNEACHGHALNRRFQLVSPKNMTPVLWKTIGLLLLSNLFMTFAWYAHLKELNHRPLIVAVMFSWGIAFFEYLIQVPANRLGYSEMNLGQKLKQKASKKK
jgi:hypothetical protein